MDLRSAMLNEGKKKEETIKVTIAGKEQEVVVKELSLDERDKALEMCQEVKEVDGKPEVKIHGNRMVVAYVILTAHYTDGKRIFELADFDLLMKMGESTPFVDKIYEAAKSIVDVDVETIKEGLKETPKD